MNPAGQRFLLVYATLGAFAVGTFTGALATFGPGEENELLAGIEPGSDLPDATPIEGQRVVLHAEIKGQAAARIPAAALPGDGKMALWSREERGQITLDGGQPAITALADLKASVRQDPLKPADDLQKQSLTPPDPSASGAAEIASVATIAKAALTPRPWKSQRVEVRRGTASPPS